MRIRPTNRGVAVAGLAAIMAIPACGAPRPPSEIEPRDPVRAADDTTLYEVTTTVLEDREHGPQLCATVADSLPPLGAGPDIVGWDWAGIPAERLRGTTWGGYTMTGTWDGERFTLVGPVTPVGDHSEPPPEPDRPDWTTDLSVATLRDIQYRLHDEFPLIYGSSVDEENRVVRGETYLATPELRHAIDARFGPRVVALTSLLRPVS